jgi:hypothetical protein
MDEHRRVAWAKALTTVGWLLVFAYLSIVIGQIRQAFQIRDSSFEDGVLGARIERVSFVVFPQNSIIILIAAAAAALASALAAGLADRRDMWTSQLIRVSAGVCYVVIVIAAVRIVSIMTHRPDGLGDFNALLQQIGGILVAVAGVRLGLEAEREH